MGDADAKRIGTDPALRAARRCNALAGAVRIDGCDQNAVVVRCPFSIFTEPADMPAAPHGSCRDAERLCLGQQNIEKAIGLNLTKPPAGIAAEHRRCLMDFLQWDIAVQFPFTK